MCDLGDYDGYCDFAHHEDRVARVAHRCDECRKVIAPGATYRKHVGKWEGDFFAMKFCRRCMLCIDWLDKRGHGWVGGRIHEDVRECALWERRQKVAS